MNDQELIKTFLATSPFLGITWLLYRSGVLGAFASRMQKNGDANGYGKKLKELESFRFEIENNHFKDLETLKIGQRDTWKAIENIRKDTVENFMDVRKDIANLDRGLARVEGKLNGNYDR